MCANVAETGKPCVVFPSARPAARNRFDEVARPLSARLIKETEQMRSAERRGTRARGLKVQLKAGSWGVLCSWMKKKSQLWHIAAWHRQQKEAAAAHLNTVSVLLMDQASLFLSPIFLIKIHHICCFTHMTGFFFVPREEAAFCCNTGIQQNLPLLSNKRRCLWFALMKRRRAHGVSVALVDYRYRPLHSKCTFSWQTCSVFHFKCLLFFSHRLAQGNCS